MIKQIDTCQTLGIQSYCRHLLLVRRFFYGPARGSWRGADMSRSFEVPIVRKQGRSSHPRNPWSGKRVGDRLAHHASNRPNSLAIVDGDTKIAWGELESLSFRLAVQLRGMGLGHGDSILLQLPNWWEYLVSYFAVHLIGAIAIQVGADWRSREVEYALRVAPAKAAIVPGEFRGFDFVEMLRDIPSARDLPTVVVRGEVPEGCHSASALLSDVADTRVSASDLRKLQREPDEISRLVFTSGTTGHPKAILHTTDTTRFSSCVVTRTYGLRPEDVALCYLPLATNAGSVWGMYLPLETGTAVALLDRFSAERVLRLMEQARVSLYCGSPTSLQAILNEPTLEQRDLDALRLIISSGSSCPRGTISRVRTRFEAPFVEVYGMNEIGWATTTLPGDSPSEVDGSVGRPFRSVEARVIDDKGRDSPPGQPGELLLRSPGMCVDYLSNPELSAVTWDDDGWLRTGDLATIDARGNITLVSRKKELIIRGGANVSPREVEEAVATYPKVHEVAVVGIPDHNYGEIVCACVVPEEGVEVSLEELREFLMHRIAFYKIPSMLVLREALPTTSMGKVRRNILRDEILGTVVEVDRDG